MTGRTDRTGSGGFTLIEVIVGMTIAALALTAGVGAMAVVQDRSVHAEAATTRALAGAATRGVLNEWLTSALYAAPNRGGVFQGLDTDLEGTPNDELILPTAGRTPLLANVTVVRLYIDIADSTAERGFVAEFGERPEDPPVRVELVPQATGLEFRYLPDVADATEWLPSWVDQRGLPRAVEMVLSADRGDTLPALLSLPLRVAPGLGAR